MKRKNNNQNSILLLLQDHYGMYTSPKEVTVYSSLTKNGTLTLTCNYPGYCDPEEHISLALFEEYNTLDDLIAIVPIRTINDLNSLIPAQLLLLVENGNIGVYCSIYNTNLSCNLFFKKRDNKYYVRDEEIKPEENEVAIPLGKPTDFVNYTLRYAASHHSP